MTRKDPLAAHRFKVEIDGLVVAHFQRVGGLSVENEVVAFQEGGRNSALLKLPGQRSLGAVSLQRGWSGDVGLFAWMLECRRLGSAGMAVRKTVDLVLLLDSGAEVGRYTLLRAWPSKWSGPEPETSSAIMIESMDLAHEGLLYRASSPPPWSPSRSASQAGLASALESAESARSGSPPSPPPGGAGAGGLPSLPGAPAGGRPAVPDPRRALAERAPPPPGEGPLGAAWSGPLEGLFGAPPTRSEVEAVASALAEGRVPPGVPSPPGPPSGPGGAGSGGRPGGAGSAAAGSGGPALPPAAPPPPAALAGPAAAGARGFVRQGGEEVAPSSGAPWSDGVQPVQPAAAFSEPSIPV